MHEKCNCGWQLPRVSLAVTREKAKALLGKDGGITKEDKVPGAVVALICPRCGAGHFFDDEIGRN